MKNISKIITMAIAIILSVSFFGFHDHTTAEACEEVPQSYDLSVIENWCGSGTERGSIRFVGAEVYTREGDTLTLIDEQGNLWDVEALKINVPAWINCCQPNFNRAAKFLSCVSTIPIWPTF